MRNKGISTGRMVIALTSFFVLTLLFTLLDPVIEDDLYAQGKDMVTEGSKADATLDKYLNQWHWWVAPFLLSIFILALSAGGETTKKVSI